MAFDVQSFMQTIVDRSTSTQYVNPPDLDDAIGIVKKTDGHTFTKDGGTEQVVLDVTFDIIDPRAVAKTGRESGNLARYSVFLDLVGGALDMGEGKNVKLGKLREAVQQNIPGQPWAPSMLEGKTCRCKLVNRKSDDGAEYCDVKAVFPL